MTTNTNTNTATTCPTLLCYGDFLTHENCSTTLTIELERNSITSHTVLEERLALTFAGDLS
jgi:hypothetical protein